MFFPTWAGLLRVVLVGTLAYAALLLLLRVAGKRTLSKMNAFDLVVTVALRSTLATVLLSEDVALAEGVLAFGLLIALQFLITWCSVRSKTVRHLVKAEPTLLLLRGRLLPRAMTAARVTEDEILAAARAQGLGSLEEIEALILETDGTITVVPKSNRGSGSTLASVESYPAGDHGQ